MTNDDPLFEILLRLANDHLILGHRLSEWCGHAPMLEENLALPNIALDLIGQARVLYSHAGVIENKGRDEDQLAYLRLERDYKNLLLVERPNGDFAYTMLRLFYFSSFITLFWERTSQSTDKTLSEIAAKAVKESRYHVRHSAQWVICLGDGTDESHARMLDANIEIAPFIGELFQDDAVIVSAAKSGLIPKLSEIFEPWSHQVQEICKEAKFEPILNAIAHKGGRQGEHTEDMGYLLAELQYVQRAYPNMTW